MEESVLNFSKLNRRFLSGFRENLPKVAKRLHRILLEQLLTDTSNQGSFCGLFAKENYGFDVL